MSTWIKTNWAGIFTCLAIAVPAWMLGEHIPVVGGPVFSIIIGMIVTMFLTEKRKLTPGISFTSKKILQYAVILLGFGMNLSVIASTGYQSLPIIISTISTSLIVAFLLYKIMKIPTRISVLIGVGSSVCGGSAIAATAPVIDANDEEIAQSISVIFLFNVIAALIFPTLGSMLGLSNFGFGLFAGTAVNDTSSVTAAASAWDAIHHSNALDTAAIVKMTRTLSIIPITLVLAFLRMKKETGNNVKVDLKNIFPYFILYFVLASVITTVLTSLGVPGSVFVPFKTLSKFLIVMAMAAIGLNTNLSKLVKNGGKPILVGLACWVSIAGVSLLMQHILGIW
jgi:uncharacterized integral membrane protein (TIGR00698 family)